MIVEDDVYFDAVLVELGKQIQRHTGENADFFLTRIRARIEHGAQLYGPTAYLDAGRDNLREADDEAADLVAYPLFQLALLNRETTEPPDGVHQLLFDAMLNATAAALKLRHARRLLSQP